jgi:uncharacterized membrane protein YuzA (DUF378 family)
MENNMKKLLGIIVGFAGVWVCFNISKILGVGMIALSGYMRGIFGKSDSDSDSK